MFLQIGFKILVCLFVSCPNCGSSDTREISNPYDGKVHYRCNFCGNEWTE